MFVCLCAAQRRLGLFDELVALLRELSGFACEKAHKLAPHNAALSQQAKQLCVRPPLGILTAYSRGTRGVPTESTHSRPSGGRTVVGRTPRRLPVHLSGGATADGSEYRREYLQ